MNKIIVFTIMLTIGCVFALAEGAPVLLLDEPELLGLGPERETARRTLFDAFYRVKAWTVLDYKDLDAVLRAQELSLSGLFAERVGDQSVAGDQSVGDRPVGDRQVALLPADYVALCSVWREGELYRLSIRIVSARSGAPFGSSRLGPLSWSEFAPRVADAVLEASGLGIRGEGKVGSAGRHGLTVDADLRGASVFLNGALRGETPLVIDGLEAGYYSLEIRKGAYAHRRIIELAGDLVVRGKLELETGNLIIRTTPPGAELEIGGESHAEGALIEDVPADEFTLLARKGDLVWKGRLRALRGKTVEVGIELRKAAVVSIAAPPDSRNRVEGEGLLSSFVGGKTLPGLYPGRYRLVSLFGEKATEREFTLGYGESLEIVPDYESTALEIEKAEAAAARRIALDRAILELGIPTIYLQAPVPDLRSEGIATAATSFVPIYGFKLLSYPRPLELPPDLFGRLESRGRIQFGIGLGSQAALATGIALSALGDSRAGGVAYGSAAVLAAVDLLVGFAGTIGDSTWYEGQMELQRRRAQLEAERLEVGR